MKKDINLNIPINAEGLTLEDLLKTFTAELNKNHIYIAGVLVQKDIDGVKVFGNFDMQWMGSAMELGREAALKGEIRSITHIGKEN